MADIIRMPKMSDTMTEGVIAAWLKKVGDNVKSGDILAEVETDKATMELESYQDGVLLHIGVEAKSAVPVDGVIAIIGKKGEDISGLLGSINGGAPAATPAPAAESKPTAKAVDTSHIKASVITMPKMSDTMTEGVIAAWIKKVGDKVEAGDILAEVETDKATMELEAYEAGYLLYTAVDAGKGVPVDGVIAVIGEKGADYQALLDAKSAPAETTAASAPVASSAPGPTPVPPHTPASSGSTNGRILASPLAKKLAREKGVDLSAVQGSGDGGRIIRRDIENFQPGAQPARAASTISYSGPVGQEHTEEIALSQMRKTIARRLSESKFSAPHFYLTMEINMGKAMAARESMNEISPVKLSFNDIVVKAVAAALRQHPDVNVSWGEDKLLKHRHIHIGVAVAVPDGLVVPVVRFADNKSLAQLSAEIKDLGQKAKDKKLQPADFQGNTFTISNLGMFGIEQFTAIVNPPDACILAVGGIKEAVIVENGQMKPGHVMKVTMSCDHRAVDGAVGAAFLKTLKGLLEDPVRILI
jgi:pyruvate dehydrogenase E2 component (dihydrolipoamide acetyltransferase)